MNEIIEHIGIVKWYGGYNSKTDRENNYGFINSAYGDVFFHRDEIKNKINISESEIVLFNIEKNGNKLSAKSVIQDIKNYNINIEKIYEEIKLFYEKNFNIKANKIYKIIKSLIKYCDLNKKNEYSKSLKVILILIYDKDFFEEKNEFYYEILGDVLDYFLEKYYDIIKNEINKIKISDNSIESIINSNRYNEILELLNINQIIDIYEKIYNNKELKEKRELLYEKFIDNCKEKKYEELFQKNEGKKIIELLSKKIDIIKSFNVSIIYSFCKYLINKFELNKDKICKYFLLCNDEYKIKLFYLLVSLSKINDINLTKENFETFSPLYLLFLLKEGLNKSIEEKKIIFRNFISILHTRLLSEDRKTFSDYFMTNGSNLDYILFKCPFQLNEEEKLYCEGKIWNLKDDYENSYETTFYCPRIKHRCDEGYKMSLNIKYEYKNWNLYNIMIIFGYWNEDILKICHLTDIDALSKISGMQNRMNELREKLKCRYCGKIMTFNMKYSKRWYAVYATTVAYCESSLIDDNHDKNVYLSHCFNCRANIDSRDVIQHPDKYYICEECGSHKTGQGDMCPKCGNIYFEERGARNLVCKKCNHSIRLEKNY